MRRRDALADAIAKRCAQDGQAAASADAPLMGLAEARATAMLLVFAGLFDEAIPPLGPTNCLVARTAATPQSRSDDPARAPVWALRGGLVENPVRSAFEAARLMELLLKRDRAKESSNVYRPIGIDAATRRTVGNVPPAAGPHPRRERRKINKALAMEMLVAELLSRIDGADEVKAQLALRNGHPYRAAGPGYGDLQVACPKPPGLGSIRPALPGWPAASR